MFQGKKKAITFSYDDGVTQDIRLVEIFNKYDLKATFNLNSMLLGKDGRISSPYGEASHNKVKREDVPKIYAGHEVAVHTCTHPLLPSLDEAEIIAQVEDDRRTLEDLVGYPVVGMAYPGGGVNNDDRVAEVIRSHTAVQYARTTTETRCFDAQSNLYRFHPTVYHLHFDTLFFFADEFLSQEYTEPKIYYIWGHSYEFDYQDTWGRFEEFCKRIAHREDVFYGTNRQVLLGIDF